VSNSLAFALIVAGVDTASGLFQEIARRWSVRTIEQPKSGLDWARPLIARCDGVDVYQVGYHGFEVDGARSPRLLGAPSRSHFSDFASYKGFLVEVTDGLLNNSGADARACLSGDACTTGRCGSPDAG
jgi:hypothetical protein